MWSFRLRLGIVVGIILGFLLYLLCFSPPSSFPKQLLFPVHSGETGLDIATALKIDHAVRSEFLFRVLLRLYGGQTHIAAGTYYFPEPLNAFAIAWRLRVGNFNIEPIKITVPEGTDTEHMSLLLSQSLPIFDANTFLHLAQPHEGFLFPDTYFFYPGESMTDIVQTMHDNFNAHMAAPDVQTAVASSGKSLVQLVIMASLLEKEAPDTKNRQIISGILWKRIELGMPLQVDAVFPYITGKSSGDITRADLQTRSPYNTYLNLGLPPGPITNPGLDSIMAAATPVVTDYLYYLSDKKGNFHYSATYAGQLANEKKYLP